MDGSVVNGVACPGTGVFAPGVATVEGSVSVIGVSVIPILLVGMALVISSPRVRQA